MRKPTWFIVTTKDDDFINIIGRKYKTDKTRLVAINFRPKPGGKGYQVQTVHLITDNQVWKNLDDAMNISEDMLSGSKLNIGSFSLKKSILTADQPTGFWIVGRLLDTSLLRND